MNINDMEVKMFGKVRKALGIGYQVIEAVFDAIDPDSDEGSNISQAEFVRICVRSGFAAVDTFGAKIVNDPDVDLMEIMKEELEKGGMA
jgi:hypothetical protein